MSRSWRDKLRSQNVNSPDADQPIPDNNHSASTLFVLGRWRFGAANSQTPDRASGALLSPFVSSTDQDIGVHQSVQTWDIFPGPVRGMKRE